MNDLDKCVSVKELTEWIENWFFKNRNYHPYAKSNNIPITELYDIFKQLPSAQPEPLSDAYMNAVWTWLLEYQIKATELKGRYTPYEVLSWVANDWRKEHERPNQQTGGD